MAKINGHKVNVEVTTKVVLELTEAEARALDGIFGYNVETFLKDFYERMGRMYVEPHESGVRSLHATIRKVVHGPLAEAEKARTAVYKALHPNGL